MRVGDRGDGGEGVREGGRVCSNEREKGGRFEREER